MLTNLLGGIGLFLLGMILMTDGLKTLAGAALRRVLARFVRGPVSALASGAGATVLVQSSSATTLTTIGFVSAGILSLPQAIGVLLGANLGTTSTGWLVSLLGLKLDISVVALPLVGFGALVRLLARERVAALGMTLAGFGLIFVGIATLQTGMQDLATRFDLSRMPGATLVGRLELVAVGFAMTVVMQSSSAAVATTLTALHAGALDLTQAAALVVGQNVGTTVTAALACIGAATAARRAAVAHILFNVVTGVLALATLSGFVGITARVVDPLEPDPGALALAAFHTAFNLLGILLFLPWIGGFARLLERLVPERGPQLTRRLDPSVAALAPVAIEATRETLREVAALLAGRLPVLVTDRQALDTRVAAAARGALGEARRFLARIRSEPETSGEHGRHLGALHALDHLERLLDACEEHVPRVKDTAIAEGEGLLIGAVDAVRPWLSGGQTDPADISLGEASETIAERRRAMRRAVLEETAAGALDPDDGLARLEVMRWIDRLVYHLWRVTHHLAPARASAEMAAAGGPRDT